MKLRDGRAQLVQVGDGIVVAQIGPVCAALWRKKPTPDRFEIQRSCLQAAVKKNPGNTVFLCVVEAGTEPPEDNIRKASSSMITDLGQDLKAVAIVVEGSGFKAAISRTVLSGIVFLIRTPSPIKYFESCASGAAWLAQFVPLGNIGGFVEQVEIVRGSLGRL
ncbi:MAG: hypothetical protein ABW061_21765 [Polyangiaceae bacterium]